MNTKHKEKARIGIDIGRVIMAPTDSVGRADTSFLSGSEAAAMETPPSEHAVRVITDLVTRTQGDVWLVSKCGPRIQKLTLKWLDHWRFYASTGMAPDHVRFCKERRDKALHARQLRLTHFVDDRLDVLQHLRGLVGRLYLFGHQPERHPRPEWVTHVVTWLDVESALRAQGPGWDSTQLARQST
jgi:hypothetical protein